MLLCFTDGMLTEILALKPSSAHCSNGLKEDHARFFFQQIIVAIDYCHKMKVSNRCRSPVPGPCCQCAAISEMHIGNSSDTAGLRPVPTGRVGLFSLRVHH